MGEGGNCDELEEWDVCNHFYLHGFRFMMECQKLSDFCFLKEVPSDYSTYLLVITAQPLQYVLPICMPIAFLMVDNNLPPWHSELKEVLSLSWVLVANFNKSFFLFTLSRYFLQFGEEEHRTIRSE